MMLFVADRDCMCAKAAKMVRMALLKIYFFLFFNFPISVNYWTVYSRVNWKL